MFFIRSLSVSAVLSLISILSMAFKDFILNKDPNSIIDFTILTSTTLFFISMVITIISFISQFKNADAKKYHHLFYILIVCIPIFILLFNVYI